ncbi:MAG TPA: hypothetical protein VNW54_13135 [Granulicella sp.]|nr:hypothetical protein [Granulicella sp.]
MDLGDGEFQERGGGMTATTYVMEGRDVMVVEVTGADPKTIQRAELKLWAPRKPEVLQQGRTGILAETWLDNQEAGASGKTFGSLAAITAEAKDVKVDQEGPLAIDISFRPKPDGSFRILVGSPSWQGGDAVHAATTLLAEASGLSSSEHRVWWNHFWEGPGLMKLSSPDHAAEYLENLRMIDLFTAAAEGRDKLPGEQAGIGDLFSSFRDEHRWGPSAYWHWNLRMQVSANLGAGTFALNDSYFNLYRSNLLEIRKWTKKHMGGRDGICVPETMRFNGQGYENETWIATPAINCGEDSKPYYNARTLSSGAEVSLWVWQQYLFTDDLRFLRENYPIMRNAALFYQAYATRAGDGSLHTYPSNAHESKWDVHDPTTDVSAMRTLWPAVIEAAQILNTDASLVRKWKTELSHLPQLALVSYSSPDVLLAADAERTDSIITTSDDPAAETHNSENIGLEPVWPYGLIGDDGPLHDLGVRTFLHRVNKNENDWSPDPVQAARLGLADEFRASALSLTERYQSYPSGLASFAGSEFYVEQAGVVADALQTALVQDYDGLVRITPAWPKDWDADGTVYIQHGAQIHVQIRQGKIITVGIETGSARTMRIRNPWRGESVEVIDARTSTIVSSPSSAAILSFPVLRNRTYLVRPVSRRNTPFRFEAISGTLADAPRSLGTRSIGIAK